MSTGARSRTAALVSLVLAITALGTAPAQEADKGPPFGEGTHAFRAILNKLKLEPIASETQFRNEIRDGNAEQILLIVLGHEETNRGARKPQAKDDQLSVLQRIPDGLETFLKNGGAVLIASDLGGQGWGRIFGRRTALDGSFIETEQPRSGYRDSRECPFVRPLPNKIVPIFDGLNKVATNRPSFLHVDSACPLDTLAVFPGDCTMEGIPAIMVRGLQLRFAIGGPLHNGRALVLADHSLFINDMLLQTDNDNFDLACSAIRWLSEDGKRTRVLFVEDGEVVSNFNVILKEMPVPPLPPLPPEAEMVRLANKLLVDLETEDYFNRTLLEAISPPGRTPESGPDLQAGRGRILQLLVLLTTVGLLMFGWHRLVRARHRIDARVPATGPELWPASVSAVVDQRQQALLQVGNLWEPARALARQFFEKAAALRPEQWLGAGLQPPQLTVTDPELRRGLDRQVRDLWRLAASHAPSRLSPGDFEHFLARLRALQNDVAAGILKFHPA